MNWIILKFIRYTSNLFGFKVILYKSTRNSVYFSGNSSLIKRLKIDNLLARTSLQNDDKRISKSNKGNRVL